MAILASSSQVAAAVPFDNSTNGFVATNVQTALEETHTSAILWTRSGSLTYLTNLTDKLSIRTNTSFTNTEISMVGRTYIQASQSGGNTLIVENQAVNSNGIKILAGDATNNQLEAYTRLGVLQVTLSGLESTFAGRISSINCFRNGTNGATAVSNGHVSTSITKGINVNDAASGAFIAGFKNDSSNSHGVLISAGDLNNHAFCVQSYDGTYRYMKIYGRAGTVIGNEGGANVAPTSQLQVCNDKTTNNTLELKNIASQTGTTLRINNSSGTQQLAIAANGRDFVLDTTTGTKFGTATTQKLSFFNATPVVQPTGGAATAGAIYTATEQDMLQKAYDCLRTLGLLS